MLSTLSRQLCGRAVDSVQSLGEWGSCGPMLRCASAVLVSEGSAGRKYTRALKAFCPDGTFTSAHILLPKESHMATSNFTEVGK